LVIAITNCQIICCRLSSSHTIGSAEIAGPSSPLESDPSGQQQRRGRAVSEGSNPPARRKTPKRVARLRFELLNAFVDSGMADLSRGELAVWLTLYRDTKRDGAAPHFAQRHRSTGRNGSPDGKPSGRPSGSPQNAPGASAWKPEGWPFELPRFSVSDGVKLMRQYARAQSGA
jgi:hypothetical protein